MISEDRVRTFALKYYNAKDELHGITHIERILALAKDIAEKERVPFDPDVLLLGAYFHGIIYQDPEACRSFDVERGCGPETRELACTAAWESQKEASASTVEGKLLHDAHLLEGGETFIITKSLVVGTTRGQTLSQTLQFIEENVLGKYHCYFASCVEAYAKKERFAEDFLAKLRAEMDIS